MESENVESISSLAATSSNMTNLKKSDAWNCFAKVEIMENSVKVTKAKCSVCNKLLSSNTTYGTSHLKRHLSSHVSTQNIILEVKCNWVYRF